MDADARPSLVAELPPPGQTLRPDEIFERFVGWVAGQGLALYPAQEEAVLELLCGAGADEKHLVLSTPTGSGKSLVAFALIFKALAQGRTAFYTCPIKALVSEKFFQLCEVFGPERVGMMTGDASVNREAPVICCTAEILANLALRGGGAPPDHVVMDEFHYYADRERGVAWQVPLLLLERTTFLLMSATLGDMRRITESLKAVTGREVAEIYRAERPVPLDFEYAETPLHETIEKLVRTGRAPVYVVSFTQRGAAEEAQSLLSVDFCTKEEKQALKEAIGDFAFDTPYGKDFQRFVRHGVGLHHAGLLPKYRLLVEKLAQTGLLKIVSGTDTLGVGVNIPIRTVLFTQLCKYDGEKDGILRAREFHQIAGRAGRKGFDDRGTVVAQAPAHVIENLRLEAKAKAGKKVTKQKPPDKGYVHWDRATFERLQKAPPEPLESRFQVTHGMLLNLLQHDPRGYRRLVHLVRRSHESDKAKGRHLRAAKACFQTLRRAGLVEVLTRWNGRGSEAQISGDLQRDFSLNQALSLYLVDTLARLPSAPGSPEDAARADEGDYPLDVLTLVEAIVENPMVILQAQLQRAKTARIDELKAAGVEYEQRMAELDKVEWPKPLRDFVYETFNAFAETHPWVGAENIRPKSIARDLVERFASFDDYVRDYGLQRSEGVLLRYLSEVYRTLVQTVPARLRTDGVEDVIAALRALVRGVDASLVEEWERLKAGDAVPLDEAEAAALDKVRLGRPGGTPVEDPKALAARIRVALHRLVRALAAKDWAQAALLVRAEEGAAPWDAARLEASLSPYFAEHAAILTTPAARTPRHTHLEALAPGRFRAQQTLVDPEGDGDWAVTCEVAVADGEHAPLLLRSIGV